MKILKILSLFLCFAGAPAFAQQSNEVINCTVSNSDDSSQFSCDVRPSDLSLLKNANLSVNGTKTKDVDVLSFKETEQTSAWLFLIDRSNPKRAKTVQKNINFARAIVENARDNQQFGIATFASDLRIVVSLGERNANLDRRLGDIEADGLATEFFAAAIEGVKLLQASNADRRALVIMSDGKAEDTAYSRADLISAARKAGIVIYGLGFAEKATETPDLQILKRLAEDTNGPFHSVVGENDISSAFRENFTAYLESGGSIEADISDVFGEALFDLNIELRNGDVINHTQTLFVKDEIIVEEPEVVVLSWIAEIYTHFDSIAPGASEWAELNQTAAIALLFLTPLLLLGLLIIVLMRRANGDINDVNEDAQEVEQEEENADDEPKTIAISTESFPNEGLDLKPVLGWFEMLDNQDEKFEIKEMSIKIGRHSDNDYKLNNDSVHRHHAHFHFTSDMKAVITDLDTVNGVLVNDVRVSQHNLASEDVIQLGEVRFRFFEN